VTPPTVQVAGYRLCARDGRVYLTELEADRDPGLDVAAATALAVALRSVAQQAIRQNTARKAQR